MERISNYEEKIDLIKKKELVNEITVAEPVKEIPVEKPEIIEAEIERAAEIEPELPEEEYFEPEKHVEYDEGEEGITDYEKFIAEELRDALRKNKIPEKPREMPREIPRNAVYEEIDRNNARPSREPEERRIKKEIPAKVNRIISRKPKIADVCDETCPFVKEQKERFMRKLKERQWVIDHYYLPKGFNYFEDVCTCSLACMVYALSRDPFVRSVFASLALFAVGLKLCSELDAWEMPNRVS
ncbi:titin-like isoform X2 [Cataglyphis hispanica]|uniref:titin-like isoform X2 n=1 Tax=Cataglyphis hispanica TaxID=1086592 RepID=UPI002180422B|nr:titin-like isoform X2 [Cataglyphis hispanica]